MQRPPASLARFALVVALAPLACDDPARSIPAPDPRRFADAVYPTLLRDCAFAGCHGDARRPLFVPGPGRVRLDPSTERLDPATAAELALAYDRARGLLEFDVDDGLPLLLEKTQAGAGHRGRDIHGDNVYEDPDAAGAEILRAWLETGR